MITTQELAKYLQVHDNTVYNLIKQGMPYYRVRADYRFDLEEVKVWLKERNK